MKLSNYTIIVDDYPEPGQYLVYSTRTQAMARIDQKLKKVLDFISKKDNLFPSKHLGDLKDLYKMGILVKDAQEDREKLRAFFNQLKYDYDKSLFAATVLTTLGCNFKCTYCFEEGARRNVKMGKAGCRCVTQWLKQRLKRLGYRGVYLNFYGGEPLLNLAAVDHIVTEMRSWCGREGISFSFCFQTNGFLLTSDLVDKYKETGLIRTRISLDGVRETHDRYRPLRGGGPTFDRIVRNIMDCADKIEVGISVGYDKGDVQPLEKLLQYFRDLGVLHKLGQFICSPIHPSLGPEDNPAAIRGAECMGNTEDEALIQSIRRIHELMAQYGLPYKSGMSISACTLTRENSGVTIDPEGRIYRCPSLLGHAEFSIGDVRHEEFNEKQKEFRDLDAWKECPEDCTYLPMCGGGCRLMAFLGGHKNFKTPSCRKAYLDKMAPEFIKRDYDRIAAKRKPTDKEGIVPGKT